MTHDRPDDWRRALSEASSLPADDPHRLEIQAEVATRGGWVEKEWLALLAEGERWRIELSRVEIPDGLEDRLLAIPDDPRALRTPLARLPRWAWAAAAAAVLVALSLWSFLPSKNAEGPVQTLALLALNDHLDAHPVEVATADPAALAVGLRERVPFDVTLPRMPDDLRLAGGRRCTLGSHAVAFTSWGGSRGRVTLLKLLRTDFDLPEDLAPTIVTPSAAAAKAHPLDVLLWTRGEFGYVVVADDPGVVREIARERR